MRQNSAPFKIAPQGHSRPEPNSRVLSQSLERPHYHIYSGRKMKNRCPLNLETVSRQKVRRIDLCRPLLQGPGCVVNIPSIHRSIATHRIHAVALGQEMFQGSRLGFKNR